MTARDRKKSRLQRGRRADLGPRPIPAASTASCYGADRTSTWRNGLLLLIATAIFAFVFVPWLNRTIQGQFLGLTGDYGTDFFRYTRGSEGWIRFGLDPYSNEEMFAAVADGRIATDHPNPLYDEQMAGKGFAPSPEPIAKGVVSPPFLLLCIYPLTSSLGYTLALNVWLAASLITTAFMSVLFWHRLACPAALWNRMAGQAAMLSLLVLAGFPVLWSVLYGQFEPLYFMALGGAIFLWCFERTRPVTPLLVGLFIAIGAAVKIFPLVLLAYFVWQAGRAVRESRRHDRSLRSLCTLPEAQVLFACVGAFLLMHLLTGAVLGFDVFRSFATKIADLQVDGTGPSMKGNLVSYLNFAPIWLADPFSPQTGAWQFLYVLAAVGVSLLIAWQIHSPVGRATLTARQQQLSLLELTLIVSALPTLMPHWWIYYNVILILPFIACFQSARKTADRRASRWILALTGGAFILTYSYLTTSVLFGAFPTVHEVFVNRAAVDAAVSRARDEPSLLEALPYSSAVGQPRRAEIEGRVPSFFNVAYGYPGTLLLFAANLIALRALRRETDDAQPQEIDNPSPTRGGLTNSAGPSRRFYLAALAGGGVASWAAGHALVWEGRRRLNNLPPVELLFDDDAIADPVQSVDLLLARIKANARTFSQVAGLVVDLPPPSEFTSFVSRTDRRLGAALLQQDHEFFANSDSAFRLHDLFTRYEQTMNRRFEAWLHKDHPLRELDRPARYGPSLLLSKLIRACNQRHIPLRRMSQEWFAWQLQFAYEYAWQQTLDAIYNGNFTEFVNRLFQHLRALAEFDSLGTQRIGRLAELLPLEPLDARQRRAGLLYVRMPVYTALSYYPACINLDGSSTLELAVQTGTLYVVEEVVRRARLAKTGQGHAALEFARNVTQRIGPQQVTAWWSETSPLAAEGILRQLQASEMLSLNELESEGLMLWSTLQPLRPD